MAKIKYVAYTDLGPGQESGTTVNPEDFGGEESADFRYYLEHGNIVPVTHPAAAIAMGEAPEVEDTTATQAAEIDILKARIAELEQAKMDAEAAKAAAEKAASAPVKPSAGGGSGAGSTSKS